MWRWVDSTESDLEMSDTEEGKSETSKEVSNNINNIQQINEKRQVIKKLNNSKGRINIIHISNFLSREEADTLLEQKLTDKKENKFVKDRHYNIETERLIFQEGSYDYVYTGHNHMTNKWTPHGTNLLEKVHKYLPTSNSCTWNFYPPNKIHMGAHSDNEQQIKTERVGKFNIQRIGTVSLGEEAIFKIITYLNNGVEDETFYFHLKHGDFIMMTDQTQTGAKHEIIPVPHKTNDNNSPRISATFRTLTQVLPWVKDTTPVIHGSGMAIEAASAKPSSAIPGPPQDPPVYLEEDQEQEEKLQNRKGTTNKMNIKERLDILNNTLQRKYSNIENQIEIKEEEEDLHTGEKDKKEVSEIVVTVDFPDRKNKKEKKEKKKSRNKIKKRNTEKSKRKKRLNKGYR